MTRVTPEPPEDTAPPARIQDAGQAAKNAAVRHGILAGDAAFTGPFGIQLGVESACNYSCLFCGQFSPLRPGDASARPFDGHMPEPVFDRLVESAARLQIEQISLVGTGEPLIHPRAPALLARIKSAGIRLMVTTNGSTLTRTWIEWFLACGLDILNVSFSAGCRDTYAEVHGQRHAPRFDTILDVLGSLTAERRRRGVHTPRLVMRCTVIRNNIGELAEWVDLALECGADELILQQFVPPGFGDQLAPTPDEKAAAAARLRSLAGRLDAAGVASNLAFMIPAFEGASGQPADFLGYPVDSTFYRSYPCLVGWTYLVIFQAGALYPCCYCSTPLGNIYEQSLEEIWFGDAYDGFRRRTRTLPAHGRSEPGCRCFEGCGSVRDNIRTISRLDLRTQLERQP